jgi:hypothetical protein
LTRAPSNRKVFMQTIEDYLHDLKAQERELLLRLSAVQSAIDAITRGLLTTALPIPAPQPPGPQGPPLNGLRMRDAIKIYLGWAQKEGIPVTIGMLEKELAKYDVVSFRNQPMKDMPYPFKSLCIALGSPDNQKFWHIERLDPDGHFTRSDRIELKVPKKESEK